MRVLVACEFSGVVRDAFFREGHDAASCDLLKTEKPRWLIDHHRRVLQPGRGYHFQCDVREILGDGWDLMVAHPPCTYLCSSGLHWNKRVEGRAAKTEEALEFVRELLDAPIPRIALENPVGCISTRIQKPDQTIQPWQFGHPESKRTCLWLKGLPKLEPTDVLTREGPWDNQTPSGQNKLGPGTDRWKKRSVTYQGIADAMAAQWGKLGGGTATQLPPTATQKPR